MRSEEPPYLDRPARNLLASARHVAKTVGLSGATTVLLTPGGVQWFPWVGTRGLRALAIFAQVENLKAPTDRLSLWVPAPALGAFHAFAEAALSRKHDSQQLGSQVMPRLVEKFDEFLPEDLLSRACAQERLGLEEAQGALKGLLQPTVPASCSGDMLE